VEPSVTATIAASGTTAVALPTSSGGATGPTATLAVAGSSALAGLTLHVTQVGASTSTAAIQRAIGAANASADPDLLTAPPCPLAFTGGAYNVIWTSDAITAPRTNVISWVMPYFNVTYNGTEVAPLYVYLLGIKCIPLVVRRGCSSSTRTATGTSEQLWPTHTAKRMVNTAS